MEYDKVEYRLQGGATLLFDKLHQGLLYEMKRNSWPIGFSIGVAVFIRLPKNGDEALGIADRIMYEVKDSSKNRVLYREIIEVAQPGHAADAPGCAVYG